MTQTDVDDGIPLMVWAYCPDDTTKYNVQIYMAPRCNHYSVIAVSHVMYGPSVHAMSVLDTAHVATVVDALANARRMMCDVGGGTADLFDKVDV